MEPIYPFLLTYLPILENATVLEIGAHEGRDTEWMHSHLKHPFRMLAFEPDSRSYHHLYHALKHKRDLYLFNHAIGAQDGEADFWMSGGSLYPEQGDEHTDSSSLKMPDGIQIKYPWMTFALSRVLVRRLDTVRAAERIQSVDFLWADIQGAELDLMTGGQETLVRTHYFYTECYAKPYYYQGQPALEQIERALPHSCRWRVAFRTTTDVLFENLDW